VIEPPRVISGTRKSGKPKPRIELRAYSPKPRPVRTSEGWRIESGTAVGRKRSDDTWPSFAEAQAAIDAGYTVTTITIEKRYPRVHRITTALYSADSATCLLCAAKELIVDAQYRVMLEMKPNVFRRIILCDMSAHDVFAEYAMIDTHRVRSSVSRRSARVS
jgi:hypothetical protein